MSDENEPKVNIDIGLGAKASFEAKVTTEIPSTSSGRLLEALTDIIRPFTERRGLKADQIRLQREDVLIEVARKALERTKIENRVPSPLPNKFLVPFLEKASLEEDSVLIDMWATLLASSSLNPEAAHPHFVQVLSQLSQSDADRLSKIASKGLDEAEDPYTALFCQPGFDRPVVRRELRRIVTLDESEGYYRELQLYNQSFKQSPGVEWGGMQEMRSIMGTISMNPWPEISGTSDEFFDPKHRVSLSYYCMTPLGCQLIVRCDYEIMKTFRRWAGNKMLPYDHLYRRARHAE